ncbi:MAG: type II secretion system protein, partial [Patescibacteria group bacterium]|nr:type II secretion system protein [Patescibacteria group bacterium]
MKMLTSHSHLYSIREFFSSTKLRVNVKEQNSFTLIELLIVIAIIGILASALVLVLNPSQLLSQSRDSRRTQDLSNLNNAIGMYLSEG